MYEEAEPVKSGLVGAETCTNKYSEDLDWDEFGNDLYAIPDTIPFQSNNLVHEAPPSSKADEESKIKALIDTPALDWQQQPADGFGAGRGYGRGPGHFIQHCPTNGDPNYDVRRVKPPTGIPKSMLVTTPDGSYALPSGASAVMKPNEAAFDKEVECMPSTRSVGELPPELHCSLCKEVMKDAVLTSKCCFKSFCDKCIRDYIISKLMCVCGATNVLADDLLPNKTLRDTINRILESNNSSEHGGSTLQVQDMESARTPHPRIPSPSQSAASRGEKLPPPSLQKEESSRAQEGMQEVKVDAALQQVLEKEKTSKVADVSEATHESISAREQTSQGSAPLVDEEVQQKQAASDAAADMQWRASHDMAADNYMMPMGPTYNPYWTGMQPGMEGFGGPFPAPMPYMNHGFGPFDAQFGPMIPPPNPFGAQSCMLPPFCPPQRDLADFAMGFNNGPLGGFNNGPPIMSREEFEARKADLKRKRELEMRRDRLAAAATSAIKPPNPHSFLSGQPCLPSVCIKPLSFSIASSPLSIPEESATHTEISSQLFSLLSFPNWQKNASLRRLLPSLSPSHVSSLFSRNPSLDPHTAISFFDYLSSVPSFKLDTQCYLSLLHILIPRRMFQAADRIRVLMVKSCESADETKNVVSLFLGMHNTDDHGGGSGLRFEFKLNVRSCNTMLMSLSRFMLIEDMKCLYLEMIRRKISPNVYTFNTIIHACCKLGNVTEAEMYLSKICQTGLSPDAHTYTSFILGHCRKMDITSARKVFDEMPKRQCQRSHVSYNVLMHGLCEAGKVDEAVELFSQMGSDHCGPNVHSYTILIDALCDLNREMEALNLFDKMVEKGCHPNVHTYTVLINGMCKDKKLAEARRLLDAMRERGQAPNVVTYNAMIDGYCKVQNMNSAMEIFNLMELNKCKPNVRTYNELISGFCGVRMVHKAMGVLDKMLEQNLSPSVVTFNLLVRGQCGEGHINSALRLLTLMGESGVAPDEWTYGSVIDALCEKGCLEHAHSIFDSLKEKGIKANEVIYTTLIDGYCKIENPDAAVTLFKRMLDEQLFPNSCTYNVILAGLCQSNKLKEATHLLERMEERGVKPTVVTYSILIEKLLKSNDYGRASEVLSLMVSSGTKPDVCTYTSFLVAYCNQGKLEEAEKLMAKMIKDGIKPDLMTYTALMDGEGRLEEAWMLVDHMKNCGMSPGEDIYNTLIKCCCKSKRHDAAAKLVDTMTSHGFLPHLEAYNFLICGLYGEGSNEKAKEAFLKLLSCGYNNDEVAWKLLIDGLLKRGLSDECSELLGVMEKNGNQIHPQTHTMLMEGLLQTKGLAKE
ncbi:unnamed protein product [Cuscuta campestris]|uniref:PROP1-like PPR domain-containing protein n=1 Tax=Cuscuta campestris TaxID=132261 RepID=A0A484KKT6_9ASTE|nr:unnamed protein product [Cuscuta campestris]